MRDNIIKKRLKSGGEKDPEPMSIGDDGFIGEQWTKQLRLEFTRLPVETPEHFGIETELIPKIAKDQGFVKTGDIRNRIDARTVKAVFREDRFSRGEDRLAGFLSSSLSGL